MQIINVITFKISKNKCSVCVWIHLAVGWEEVGREVHTRRKSPANPNNLFSESKSFGEEPIDSDSVSLAPEHRKVVKSDLPVETHEMHKLPVTRDMLIKVTSVGWWLLKNIRIEEIARGQLMTYTRQFLVPHPWNIPIFIHPTLHLYPYSHTLIQSTDSALTTCLPSLFQSFTTPLVNQYLPRSVLNLRFSSLYSFPRVLSWLLTSKTWSMFPLLVPFTHWKTSIISPLALLISRE